MIFYVSLTTGDLLALLLLSASAII